jgi:hypothetical protein
MTLVWRLFTQLTQDTVTAQLLSFTQSTLFTLTLPILLVSQGCHCTHPSQLGRAQRCDPLTSLNTLS